MSAERERFYPLPRIVGRVLDSPITSLVVGLCAAYSWGAGDTVLGQHWLYPVIAIQKGADLLFVLKGRARRVVRDAD